MLLLIILLARCSLFALSFALLLIIPRVALISRTCANNHHAWPLDLLAGSLSFSSAWWCCCSLLFSLVRCWPLVVRIINYSACCSRLLLLSLEHARTIVIIIIRLFFSLLVRLVLHPRVAYNSRSLLLFLLLRSFDRIITNYSAC